LPNRRSAGELKKGKGGNKLDVRFKPKKGVKPITTSRMRTRTNHFVMVLIQNMIMVTQQKALMKILIIINVNGEGYKAEYAQ
jgi:hypothetical protein